MGSTVHSSAGKVIILTGAGAGIGLAITNQLLSNSSVSLVVGIDVKTLEIESLLEKHQDRLAVIQGDVSDRTTSERAVETALHRTGRLDALILNAAILHPIGPAAATKVEEWKRLFDVNFFGLLHTIQLALPHLRQTGQILMTSSGTSLSAYAAWIPYACSKAAMNWLCAGLAVEEDQVTLLCVTPGIVDSGQQAEVRNEYQSNMPPEQYKWLADLHARGELLSPEQPASSFVRLAVNGIPKALNGQVIPWNDPRVLSAS